MSEKEKNLTRKELEEQVINKAQSDGAFKKALVASPKAAIEQMGFKLYEDLDVKVVEESADVMYLVLPSGPDELTDRQLDAAVGAGGIGCDGVGGCRLCQCKSKL